MAVQRYAVCTHAVIAVHIFRAGCHIIHYSDWHSLGLMQSAYPYNAYCRWRKISPLLIISRLPPQNYHFSTEACCHASIFSLFDLPALQCLLFIAHHQFPSQNTQKCHVSLLSQAQRYFRYRYIGTSFTFLPYCASKFYLHCISATKVEGLQFRKPAETMHKEPFSRRWPFLR